MKRSLVVLLCFLLSAIIPLVYFGSRAEFSTDAPDTSETGTETDTGTGTDTDVQTETDTESPFEAGISIDGSDEVEDLVAIYIYVYSDELRGGTMTLTYDPSVLSKPAIVQTSEEDINVTLRSDPGRLSVLFITDEPFIDYVTLLTLGFSVLPGANPENIEITLCDIVFTDGSEDLTMADVTYVARYINSGRNTLPVTTEEPETEPPATEPAPETEREPVTTRPEPQTTEEPATEAPATTEEITTEPVQTETEKITETETVTEKAITTAADTEPEPDSTEEIAITAEPTVITDNTDKNENNASEVITAVIIAAVIAAAAVTAVFIVKKSKKTEDK